MKVVRRCYAADLVSLPYSQVGEISMCDLYHNQPTIISHTCSLMHACTLPATASSPASSTCAPCAMFLCNGSLALPRSNSWRYACWLTSGGHNKERPLRQALMLYVSVGSQVAWPHQQAVFPHLTFRLGLAYCFNRSCCLVLSSAPTASSGAHPAAEDAAEAGALAQLELDPPLPSAMEPRFSPDGSILIFMSHEQVCLAHSGSAALQTAREFYTQSRGSFGAL